MMLDLIDPPPCLPVADEDLWAQLRLWSPGDPDPEDKALIHQMGAAATARIDGRDGYLGRALITQTWALSLEAFPPSGAPIGLPLPPLQSVDEILYIDPAGHEQLLDPSAWFTVKGGGWRPAIHPQFGTDWPRARSGVNAVRVLFTCGYPPADTDSPPSFEDLRAHVPQNVKAAILLTAAHLYAHREDVIVGASGTAQPLPNGAAWLLAPLRIPGR